MNPIEPAHASAPTTTRDVETFLYFEAHLLDEWRLNEWLELLTDDAEYEIPATGMPESDCGKTLALVYDDRPRINARVKQYIDGIVYAEVPRSRLRRMINNVRIVASTVDTIQVAANFVLYRFASERMDVFVGHLEYALVRSAESFKIRKRRLVLDHDSLREQCMLSVIL